MSDFIKSGFGAVLRQRREELGLTLNDLAASTRVRKTYLQALEEENLQMLPGVAYAVGFLRIYARHLGLSAEPLIATLMTNESVEEHPALSAMSGDLSRGARKTRRKKRAVGVLLLIFLLLLLLLAGGYLYYRVYLRTAPPQPAAAAAPDSPAKGQVKHAPANPPSAPVPPAPVQAAAQGQPAPPPAELEVIPAGGGVVRMVPVAAGTMKVSLDGQEVREYQLQPDHALNWKVSATLAVELSAPALARVWVDQQEVAVAEQASFILKRSARGGGRQ